MRNPPLPPLSTPQSLPHSSHLFLPLPLPFTSPVSFRNLNSLTAVLTWSRATLFLNIISPRTRELANTLATAAREMSYLLLLFFFVFFGFVLGFQQAFGDFIVQFSSLGRTCFNLFKALSGDMEGMSDIPKSNRYLGPVLYGAYLIVIFFVLLNMVLGVVVKSYEKIEHRCVACDLLLPPPRVSRDMRPHRLREKAASAVGVRARLLQVHVRPAAPHLAPHAVQGLKELKNAMFTPSQMQQIDKAAAAISSGDSVMGQQELQELYNQVACAVLCSCSCDV